MKIFQLLTALSNVELKLLRKAVQSPLYNTNPMVVRLFEVLRPKHPTFDDSLVARQKLFKKLFPKEPYNDYKLRWHFTELTKVIEKLLLYIAQENDSVERHKKLIEIYLSRKLNKLFFKNSKEFLGKTVIDNNGMNDAPFYLNQFQVLTNTYAHPLYNKYDYNEDLMEQASEALDIYFVLKKILCAISLKTRGNIQGKQYDYRFLEAIREEDTWIHKHPILNLYFQSLQSIDTSPNFNFDEFETSFFKYLNQLGKESQELILTLGINYLIRSYNKGLKVSQRLLTWYKKGLELNLLIQNGIMEESTFGNIIIQSSQVKAFEFAKTFINKYQSFLKKENRIELKNFYEGVLFYRQNNLDEALARLNQYQSLSQYSYRTKIIIVRILFEKYLKDTTYYYPLMAAINNFQALIKRNKYFYQGKFNHYDNFISLLRKLIRKLKHQTSNLEVKNWLTIQLENSELIYGRTWLNEQANKL